MFCANCGNEIKDSESKFCPRCGKQIKSLMENQQPQQTQSQTQKNKSGLGLIVIVFLIIQVINIFVSYIIGKQTVENRMVSSPANVIKYGLMSGSDINNEIMQAALIPFICFL